MIGMNLLDESPTLIDQGAAPAIVRVPVRLAHETADVPEALRLATLGRYNVLDTTPEEWCDRLARMAAVACDAPVGVVSFIGDGYVACRGSFGIDATDLYRSFLSAALTFRDDEMLIVDDAAMDERLADHPLVVSGAVRFLAAVPLRSPEGFVLGALCILDARRRHLTPEQWVMLRDFAAVISRDLDLRRASSDFRAIFQKHPIPMWIYEIETLRVLAANDHALQHYGYSREEFLSLRTTDLSVPADVPALLSAIGRFDGSQDRSGPWRHRRADGSVIWADLAVQGIVFDGKPAVLASASDVTEQLTWKRAHQATDERFALLVNAVDDYAIVLLDPVGRIISWNRGAERLYGLGESAVLGRPTSDFFPEGAEGLEEFLGRFRGTSNAGALHVETQQYRSDRSIFWAHMVLNPLHDENGHRMGFAQVTHDITLRRAHEQSLIEARERAERINEITSRHLINVSHSIRTPLAGIVIAADVIGDEADEDLRPLTDSIKKNGEYLLEMVETAIEFVQLQGDQEDLALEDVDLVAQAAAVVDRYAERARTAGITLDLEAAAPAVHAAANRDVLERALLQVVRNAIKFTRQGGVVIRVIADDHGPRIEVEDSGIGISPEFQSTMFEPFAREDSGDGTPPGSGLGLAVAHHQMLRMGGSITATSEKPGGSHVVLHMPRTEGE
jgi:PAS domain S-box-containing protein